MKVYSNVTDHMNMPIYGEKLQKSSSSDLETWYTASGIRILQMFSYDDPGLTLAIL